MSLLIIPTYEEVEISEGLGEGRDKESFSIYGSSFVLAVCPLTLGRGFTTAKPE